MTPFEWVLLVLILGAAFATALSRDVLAAIVLFGGYGLGMAVLWIALRAPDVGLTEAAVGAGLLTVLFLVTIANTTRLRGVDATFERIQWPTVLAVGALVGLMGLTLPALPPVGDPNAPAASHVAAYYLEHAYEDTGIENAVTAILVAYRGFDTFGEVVVIFTAGVGTFVVLGREILE